MLHRRLSTLAVLSALALGGCAVRQNVQPATLPALSVPPDQRSRTAPDNVPPDCKGQKTEPKFASDTDKLATKGGKVCIPAFGGYGGTIAYPGTSPSITLTLTSSTTNYTGKLPKLHAGKPLFYLQVATSGATTFGPSEPAGGGLTGAKIIAGKTYTVYGQVTISGIPFNFTPCDAVATKGPYGGVIGGVGTPLEGHQVPAPASGVIEIFLGQSGDGPC
jgi:hypothetical protein